MYGKVKEAVVLVDKKGNSKGYGFVTFDNATSALEAAKDPKKRIDNRVTHCNLAFKGNPKKFAMNQSGGSQALSPKQRENANDRRLFVHSLAWKTDDESLADVFREYGELQEAVVIRDKKTGKSKGYGFVTFKYSESAQQALAEPNKKIDGRQTHCNYACERSNISGGGNNTPNNHNSNDSRSQINSPNSAIGSSSNLHGNTAVFRNDQSSRSQQSIQSLTSPSMNMSGLSNQSQQSNQRGMSSSSHPTMNTFNSNPSLSLNMSQGRGGSMNTLSNNMGMSSGMNGIDISSLSSIPNMGNIAYRPNQMGQPQNKLGLGMPGAPSPQRRSGIPYAPTNTYQPSSHQSPYGHNPHSSRHDTSHNNLSHIISPNNATGHNDPSQQISMLRAPGGLQPTSPIPTMAGLTGMAGIGGMASLHGLMRNQGGGNNSGLTGNNPSNLVLGHSQNTHHQQSTQGSIVVSGVSNNLFTSPMPPQPPATPPYTHVQTNKENQMPTNSPYYGGNNPSLTIPSFKPGGGLNTIGVPSIHQNHNQQKKIIAAGQQQQTSTAPTMMNLQPQAILNNAQQQLNAQQNANNNNKRLVGNVGINNNSQRINMNQQQQGVVNNNPPKPAPLKINNNVTAQPTVEGNISPKSQCGDSDDEGEDDVNKK
eukprot:CAMPEP_0201594972 /NCGR_PEP_ID=MMETSP0190_2-20130828/192120_1 /ASSEMBLY_ACC=CAM_ASM_000263 /TAXON_ID=37353 /ORGANISM="Rosalina sp." /LENGTH=647 /DNA_ID=CAMNT_0048054789 /DNA_START=657 /DNA_END=2600 /DNA_ORIENTATION=+